MSNSKSASANSEYSRFTGSILDVFDRVSYRRVRLEDTQDPIYRLRYEAYRRENFIAINSQRTSGDAYDLSPNAYCFGVYLDDRLISSIRFHLVSPEERSSPSRSIFPELLDPILDAGKTYVDPSRFTADHEATLAYPILPFLTTRIVVMASDFFEVDYCLSSVRPEHGAFYRRVFHSKAWSDERYYDGLNFPVIMYVADVPQVLEGIYRRYPSYRSTPQEREQLFGGAGVSAGDGYVAASARNAQVELAGAV